MKTISHNTFGITCCERSETNESISITNEVREMHANWKIFSIWKGHILHDNTINNNRFGGLAHSLKQFTAIRPKLKFEI